MNSQPLNALSGNYRAALAAIRAEKEHREKERRARDTAKHADEIRARCQSLFGFVKEAWPILEPKTPFVEGWVIRAICDHLEAVTRGEIQYLLINVPPGMMKSLLVSVLWPAWEWAMGCAHLRYLTSSYSEPNVIRDNLKMRRLVESDWYQDLWGDKVKLVKDQNAKKKFENTATGFREGRPWVSLTGGRGDRNIFDDPHSTETAESDTERATTVRIFREGASDRLNDLQKSAVVVIMQRLHANDVSGCIIKLGLPYVHLCLPMEFEPDRRCSTKIGFADPRTYEGELLFPERFPREEVERLKKTKGSYAWAGQYQQRPTAREGGLFKRHWFADKIRRVAPAGTQWVRHWDLAATAKKTAARTAGVMVGRAPDGTFWIGSSVTLQEEGNAVMQLIKATAETDGKGVEISLPQDPGQAGKVQATAMVSMLAGWIVHAEPETGDKVTRAVPFSVQCEAGNVYLVEGAWNADYIDELCQFPSGTFKDQVDASSGAFGRLTLSENQNGAGWLAFAQSELARVQAEKDQANAGR